MNKKKIISFLMISLIIGLCYYLVIIIKEPIDFKEVKDKRYAKVVEKLKDIRTAQLAYKMVKGRFANDFEKLLQFIKNDSMPIINTNTQIVDDTTTIVKRDTSFQPVLTSIFTEKYPVDSLCFIPFGNGTKFELQSGEIKKGNIPFPVFMVSAANSVILNGLDMKYYKKSEELQVGSMTDATYAGNWE